MTGSASNASNASFLDLFKIASTTRSWTDAWVLKRASKPLGYSPSLIPVIPSLFITAVKKKQFFHFLLFNNPLILLRHLKEQYFLIEICNYNAIISSFRLKNINMYKFINENLI